MGFSNEVAKEFRKPGRPTNDAIRERLRIYRAACPLIIAKGVRRTTMTDVARAAFISPGGIYHYFGSKEQLVLYGLEPEALSRACMGESAELHEALARVPAADLAHVVSLYVEKTLRMLEFVRPALHAAIELGRPKLQQRLAVGLKQDADALMSVLSPWHVCPAGATESADAIRRTILGLAVDENVTPVEGRRQLQWLFRQLVPAFRLPESAA